MTVRVESDGALSTETQRAIEQQARMALTRYSGRIRSVRVQMARNHAAGCAVRILGRRLEPVIAEAQAEDAGAALREAFERARRTLERRLRQEKER